MGKKHQRRVEEERRRLLDLLENLVVVRLNWPAPGVSGHPTYEYALRTTETDMTKWTRLYDSPEW